MSGLLYPLNQFMETVYTGLRQNLTFNDNILSFQKNLQFTTASDYIASGTWTSQKFAIPSNFSVKVSGVWIIAGGPTNLSFKNIAGFYLHWTQDNTNIVVDWIGGLANSTEYSFTVLVI